MVVTRWANRKIWRVRKDPPTTESLPFLRRFAAALARPLLLRHLCAGLPRFGEADRDRLLAALDASARPAALQRAALALVHRALDLLARLLPVLSHAYPPYPEGRCMRVLCRTPEPSNPTIRRECCAPPRCRTSRCRSRGASDRGGFRQIR